MLSTDYTINTSNALAVLNERHTLAQNRLIVEALTNEKTNEVLEFLARRPLHTVMMTGMIRDNGIQSKFNRGDFYACRNGDQQIEGLALIGHLTLLETQTERARKALAQKAREYNQKHLIVGEQERLQKFWQYYSKGGQQMRLAYSERLYALMPGTFETRGSTSIRRAETADLDLIIPIQARLAEEESGVNPLVVDPNGFRERCARRIKKGRIWVVVENNEIVFKTDVMVDTNEVVYIEGVYVAASKRGQDYGKKCLSHLCRKLLEKTNSICLLVNELNTQAIRCYEKVGFQLHCFYQHIFLQKAAASTCNSGV